MAASLMLAACGGGGSDPAPTPPTTATPPASPVQVFDQSTAPAKLSVWKFLQSDGSKLTISAGVTPYDLNSALFSDYAFKFRALYVPAGAQITYTTDGTLKFPIGTVIMKTFYYPTATGTDASYLAVVRQTQTSQGSEIDLRSNHLIETRVLVLQPDNTWSGLPYVWDDDQRDAKLTIGGDAKRLELVADGGTSEKFSYAVPNAQQCTECHVTSNPVVRGILPIGPKARNLNKSYAYSATVTKNQLTNLDELKLLSGFTGLATAPSNVVRSDATQTLEARAMAYLDVSCAHCHNPGGAASQSGLMLELATIGRTVPSATQWGVCKKPLAYSGAPSPYKYDISPGLADQSILIYRSNHTAAADAMPAIGRAVNHTEAVDMLRNWINQLNLPTCI
jgi:uncharacterized repeat protein (TIGR03806 family)